MQFTPETWTELDWFNSNAFKRTVAVYLFVLIWLVGDPTLALLHHCVRMVVNVSQLTELNTFFLKHVFAVDTKHSVVFWRIILIALISAPSIRLV